MIEKRDQNGTIHVYEYDNLGRLLHDKVTTLGLGVDGLVRKISTVYNVAGNVESVTSYDVASNIVNEVKYEYDTNGLLAKEYQNPTGSVSGASPYAGYTYDTIANGLRTIGLTYPSGKTLTYDYDALGNVATIKEGVTPLVQYLYDGTSTPVQTTYNEPGLTLDYTSSNSETTVLNTPDKLGSLLYYITSNTDGFGEGIPSKDPTFIAQFASGGPVTMTSTQPGKSYGVRVNLGGGQPSATTSMQWSGARKGFIRFSYRTTNVQSAGGTASCRYLHECYNNGNSNFAQVYAGSNGSTVTFNLDTGGEWKFVEREFGHDLPIHQQNCIIDFNNATGTLEMLDDRHMPLLSG